MALSRTAPAPGAGIVHIGLGAFHRAHQAVFTQGAMAAAGGDWGIVAVAPNSVGLIETLRAQDHVYSVTTRSAAGDRTDLIESIVDTRHLPTEPAEVEALLAAPHIRVVTLTVTEKAYRLPTIPGLLAAGIRRREAAGAGPLAVVSCDNLPDNGARLAALVEHALGAPLPAGITFPATMVDRIVPASTAETLARAAAALGQPDPAAVEAEPYSQWVIQDVFAGERPDWAAAGAILTDDVSRWERLKLRVLNGLHSTTAYLGSLAGWETVAEAVRQPGLADLLRRLAVEHVAPTLDPPPGTTVEAYADLTLGRFANPAIQHRTIQVAMDGSQKLPQRVLGTIADRRARGLSLGLPALTLAAWMRFVGGTADDGRALPLDDPMAEEIRAARPDTDDPRRIVCGLLGLGAVFPPEWRDDTELVDEVTGWLAALTRDGAAATVRAAAGRESGGRESGGRDSAGRESPGRVEGAP